MNDKNSLRSWIKEKAKEKDVSTKDLLMLSQKNDPMWQGTEADHKKAKWFQKLWKRAVKNREEKAIHTRGIHYFVIGLDVTASPPLGNTSWGKYENTEKCYNYLSGCSMIARILGYVPLNGILDHKHNRTKITEYQEHKNKPEIDSMGPSYVGYQIPDIPEVDERAKSNFKDKKDFKEFLSKRLPNHLSWDIEFDESSQEPFHVELWSEKALPDSVKKVAKEKGVNVIVEGEGDLSLSIANDLVKRTNEAEKPAVILYLSDFDPKGFQMPSNMAAKFAWLKKRGDLKERVFIKRIAVTKEQIEEYNLTRKPIDTKEKKSSGKKAYNTLVNKWEEKQGSGAVELNALEVNLELFKRIVRKSIEKFRDSELYKKNRKAKKEWKKKLKKKIKEAVEELELSDQISNLNSKLEEFNKALKLAEEEIGRLQDLKKADEFKEWKNTVKDLLDDIEIPEIEAPKGEAPKPENFLYDSAQSYLNNLKRVKKKKGNSETLEEELK